jgi:hypothetical protein
MLLVASLAQASNLSGLAPQLTAADAALFAGAGTGAQTMQRIARSMADAPWGLLAGDIEPSGAKAMIAAGGDFAVFPVSAPVAAFEETELGKILLLETALSEGLLRTINELPVDAVLIAEPEGASTLTWQHLMHFQRFASALTKPLLASIPLEVTADELQAIWKIGISGVAVEVVPGAAAARLKELRRTIDSSTFLARQQRKTEALVPRLAKEKGAAAEAEEEEEEDI